MVGRAERLSTLGLPLEGLREAGLFEDLVSQMPGFNLHRNRKTLSSFWVLPDIVVAAPVAHERAAVLRKNCP